MSDSIQKLRETLREERDVGGFVDCCTTDRVLAAVEREMAELREWKRQALLLEETWDEQAVAKELDIGIGHLIRPEIMPAILRLRELAELRRTCPDCGSPQPGDMCAVCALTRAEAELVELRKRPTYDEITRAVWEGAPLGRDGNAVRLEVARNIDKVFDGKPHYERVTA